MARARKQSADDGTPAVPSPPLPDGWRWFRFDELAQNVNERVDDPSEAGVEHYVGLEHLDADSLKIRRWGTPDDVEAQKLRFHEGDIIFGKRRAYQRKLGVAEFEGICSAHAMVLRAKPANIVPELLPFFMQTDTFMNRAVAISKGSLSPTINWTDLAKQRFAIPADLPEQAKVAEILLAADASAHAYEECTRGIQQLLSSLLKRWYSDEPKRDPCQWHSVRLEELCGKPITYGIVQAGPDTPDGVPYIRVSDMTKGALRSDGMLRTSPAIAASYGRSMVSGGDLVFALRGDVGLILPVPPELAGANLTQGTARISISPGHYADYVLWAIRSPFVVRQINLVVKGSTFKEITLDALRKLQIPIPININIEREISDQLNRTSNQLSQFTTRVQRTQSLKLKLLNHLLAR